MPSILAIDQGTTGSRALVVREDGRVIGRAYREFTQHFPQPGWVEHDAREIWQVTCDSAREALAQAGEAPAGIGITNQRETVVLWDRRTLEPVTPAIVWQDRRTAARCAALKAEGREDEVRRLSGLLLDPYFSATKLEYLLRDPVLRRGAESGALACGTMDSWLIARLTSGAVHVTDHTNASRTLLYGLERHDWEPALLELFGIPPQLLPRIVASSGVIGECDPAHFGRSLPIAGIAGDQQAALFGQGCVRPGLAKNTYGTGAFLLSYAGPDRPAAGAGLLTTIAAGPRGEPAYALEGSVFVAGAAVQWLRDGLGIIATAGEAEALARSVTDTGGVHFVPAFVGLGSPHWEPGARGTITGLTRGTGRAHLVRAALEAMAFGSADLLEAMVAGQGRNLDLLRVDGGAAANDWLMSFQADVLGVPIERPAEVETTVFGAAALAGLALGVWRSLDECLQSRTFTRFDARVSAAVREELRRGWSRAVRAALGWAREG
jgi:glycerol kinase